MKIPNILLADDHELILTGLSHILTKAFDIENLVMLKDADKVLEVVKERQFDLYILDLEFKEMSGFDLIRFIRNIQPEARIIVNTMHEEIWYISELLSLKVNGVVSK